MPNRAPVAPDTDVARLTWLAMSHRKPPRNVQSVSRARARGIERGLVVSFVGETCIEGPHVYVDSGGVYDWRFALDLPVAVVVTRGVDARPVFRDLFLVAMLYPTIVDFDREHVGSVVEASSNSFQVRLLRQGSEPWLRLFAA